MERLRFFFQRYSYLICLTAYAVILIGLHAAGRFPRPGLYDLSRLIGTSSVVIDGKIVDFPVTRWNQTRFLFEGETSPLDAFRGRVVVTLRFPRPDLGPGDRLQLRGWLSAPRSALFANSFDEKRYWEGFDVFALMRVWSEENSRIVQPASAWAWRSLAWSFQRRFRLYWEERLSPDEAGLLLGVCIGGRGRLSKELKNDCIRAGVYHIMVVSGQNVAIIILLGLAGLRLLRVPARYNAWICLGPLVFYSAVVGADPPVVRAVVTALALLIMVALRRDAPRLQPFFLAAGWILVNDPSALLGASFQLSFGATACLLAVVPFFKRMQPIRPAFLRWMLEAGLMSLAVNIGLWPLLVFYFHRLSLMGLVANWTLFPLSEVLMVLGLGVGMLGMTAPFLVPHGVETAIRALAGWTLRSIEILARPSWAAVPLEPPSPWVFGVYYGLLFSILLAFYRRRNHDRNQRPLSPHRPRLQPLQRKRL